MPRLETLSEIQRKSMLFFPCLEYDSIPWSPLTRELSRCKVALVTSAGLHRRCDPPFQSADPSYRVIPSDTPAAELIQSHTSIGFDRTGIYRDINTTLPLDRMRELAESGAIGGVARNYYSFMGALRDPSRAINETGPEVARLMQDEGVDLVFLTPT
jgi:D-proline reductase (dithiol) PrdB